MSLYQFPVNPIDSIALNAAFMAKQWMTPRADPFDEVIKQIYALGSPPSFNFVAWLNRTSRFRVTLSPSILPLRLPCMVLWSVP